MTEHTTHTSGIDHSVHGLTQLRVHGVSGTPAAAMLAHPPDLLERQRGDGRAGFYRRWYPGGTTPDSDAGRLEAYSWGGLTSGPASRALWLLFLPFVLVDLAHWMLPPLATGRPDRSARLASTTLRLLALSLTFTFLIAISVVTLDIGAWQCAPVPRCAKRFAPLGWIGGLDPGARLAVAALVPAAIVVILWRLGRQDLRPHGEPPPGAAVQPNGRPLANRAFWNGDTSELRLRAVHIAAWSSALGALVLAPTLQAASNGLGRSVIAVLLVLHLSVLGACIGVTCSERVTGRGGEGRPGADRPLQRLRWGSLLLLATGLVAAAVVPARWDDHPDTDPTALPYLREVVPVAFYVQVLLLVLLVLAVLAQRPGRIGKDVPGFTVALRGLAAPATAFSAWLVAVTFGVGIGLAGAKYLGVAVNSAATANKAEATARAVLVDPTAGLGTKLAALQRQTSLIVPPGYFWTGTAVVVMLAALVGLVLCVVAYVLRATNRLALEVVAEYPGEHAPDRARSVARGRVLAGLTDHVDELVGPLLLVALLEVAVGSVLFAVSALDRVESGHIGTATAFGVYLTGLAAAGLVSLGFLAFREANVRRYVGILWDVATFWPRANHPLTPPCYGERAVPELENRTAELTTAPSDVVVLSAHSQGSVLAAAMLMRPQQGPGRVALLTYGAPLRRLYARFFPAYFGPLAFRDTLASTSHRWVNLYALSDPIGAWVLTEGGLQNTTEGGEVDVRVVEPTSLAHRPDGSLPPTCGHSGYTGFHAYDDAVRALTVDPGGPAAGGVRPT